MYKKLYLSGFAVYALLFVFSIEFARERIIFLDMASNLFYILEHGSLVISHYRFGDAVSQLFPLGAMKAGLSLPWVVNAYSSGYIIYSLAAYIICGSLLDKPDFALVVLLQNILFSSHTFYALSQLPQSITLILLLHAVVLSKRLKTNYLLRRLMIVLLLVTAAFFHPLSLFAMYFSIAFFVLSKDTAPKKLLFRLSGLYILVLALKFIVLKTPYESHSISGLKNFITCFPNYITLYSNQHFLYNCIVIYYWIPVLVFLITAHYFKTRNYPKLTFFLLSFFGYLGLVNISYPTAVTPDYYLENLYMPLGVLLSLPLVFDLMPNRTGKKWPYDFFVLIFLTGVGRIYASHSLYTTRLNYYRNILDAFGPQKVVIDAGKTNKALLMTIWGAPYEFVLLSECERHYPASIIIDEFTKNYIWTRNYKKELIVNWNIIPYKALPQQYFQFTDTLTGYRIDPPFSLF